ATWIHHQLPRSVVTFASFYESWIAQLRTVERPATAWRRLRAPLLSMVLDAALLVALIVGAASIAPRVSAWAAPYGIGANAAPGVLVIVALALGILCVFATGRHAIRLARILSTDIIPLLQPERDLGRAPRRALELTLELVALLLVGLPVAAV